MSRVPGCVTRREFLRSCACSAVVGAAWCTSPSVCGASAENGEDESRWVREALYYKPLGSLRIECELCPRRCQIDDLERGYCGVRENRGGTYYTLVYGRACTYHADPIEKKPFFHFLPSTLAFSIATAGCNMDCKYCQNWEISQARPEQITSLDLPPRTVAELSGKQRCHSIAYTYSEPVVFLEYVLGCAEEGKAKGLKSVLVSNGYIEREPLREACRALDAIKIDLKAFREPFYSDICDGELGPVLKSIETIGMTETWLEIVYLVVPGLNDSPEEISEMSRWVTGSVGTHVPVHFSRYHPTYKMKNLPPTPVSVLERARNTALDAGLKYSYVGNVPGHQAENTYCASCGKIAIGRLGYTISSFNIKDGKCSFCGETIEGVW